MGQILRVSVAMHVLFHIESDAPIADSISNKATEAAINFVEVCCQHTAYISGRGKIDDELELVVAGEGVVHETVHGPQQESNETLLLNLPGKFLDVSFWVHQKRKFRNRGGIEGALQALTKLQEDGMGKLPPKKTKGTVKVGLFFLSSEIITVTFYLNIDFTLGF